MKLFVAPLFAARMDVVVGAVHHAQRGVVVTPQQNLVLQAAVGLGEHLEIGVPAAVDLNAGVHHMVVRGEGVVAGYSLGGVHGLVGE